MTFRIEKVTSTFPDFERLVPISRERLITKRCTVYHAFLLPALNRINVITDLVIGYLDDWDQEVDFSSAYWRWPRSPLSFSYPSDYSQTYKISPNNCNKGFVLQPGMWMVGSDKESIDQVGSCHVTLYGDPDNIYDQHSWVALHERNKQGTRYLYDSSLVIDMVYCTYAVQVMPRTSLWKRVTKALFGRG